MPGVKVQSDERKFLQKLRDLEIQGASEVARASAAFMKSAVNREDSKTDIIERISEISSKVLKVRPTEPMVKNMGIMLISALKKSKTREPYKYFEYSVEKLLKRIEENRKIIARKGSPLVKGTVMTHCHSHTVMSLFKEAQYKCNSAFKVINTETRPAYQGRKTARELLGMGLPVKMIVDSAVRYVMEDVDSIFVGADLITLKGEVVNKIGTSEIALIAKEYKVPFYVVASTLKIDPSMKKPVIEMRPPEEVWPEHPNGLEILNPAFGITPVKYITGIITEKGIVKPREIKSLAKRLLVF